MRLRTVFRACALVFWIFGILFSEACSPGPAELTESAGHDTAGVDGQLDTDEADTSSEEQTVTDVEPVLVELSWIDASRDRTLPLRIHAPGLDQGAGPFPTIVLSHGFGESPAAYDYLAAHWARSGYIVVAVRHLGTDDAALAEEPGGVNSSMEGRPGDLAFVVDSIAMGSLDGDVLGDRVDRSRIGAAGHSLGSSTALTTVGLSMNLGGAETSFLNAHVSAALAMSPQIGNADPDAVPPLINSGVSGIHDLSWEPITAPVMVMWGTNDGGTDQRLTQDPSLRRIVYERASSEERHMVILEDGEHHAFTQTDPWYPGGERDPRHHDWIQQVTTDFFDAYLKDDEAARLALADHQLESTTEGEAQQSLDAREPQGTLYGEPDGGLSVTAAELVELYDPTRDKDVQLRITHPEDAGPHPLVFLSHFAGGTKDFYPRIATHWASHGYVVVQPNHIDSPQVGGERGEFARQNRCDRPFDVSLVIDQIDQIAQTIGVAIDASLIGSTGHALGADTAGLLLGTQTFGDNCDPAAYVDPRITAAIQMSPQGTGEGLTENSWEDVTRPLMVITGSENPSERTGNPPEWRTEPYLYAAPGDKHLLFIEGLDGDYDGLLSDPNANGALARYILAGTLAFLDSYLRSDSLAADYLAHQLEPQSWGVVQVSSR